MGKDARRVKKKFVSDGGPDTGKDCYCDCLNDDIMRRKISLKYIISKGMELFIIFSILIKIAPDSDLR